MELLCPPNYCIVKKPKYNNNFVGSISDSYECISKDNRTVPVTIFKDSDENSCHLKELYHMKGYNNKNCDSSINEVIQLTPNHPKISTCHKNNNLPIHKVNQKMNNKILKQKNKIVPDDFTLIVYYILISVIIIELILIIGCSCKKIN